MHEFFKLMEFDKDNAKISYSISHGHLQSYLTEEMKSTLKRGSKILIV